MRIDIVCAITDSVTPILQTSILRRAQEQQIVEYHVHNLHDYATDRFRHIDDTRYGGGAGMILQCEPVFRCIEKLLTEREYDEVIYLTPEGQKLTQSLANSLSLARNIILLAGHYSGIDQRIRDVLVRREISIGDYVLSGGELPAVVLCDAIVRLVPGVLGDFESALDDSFQNDLLSAPDYTRPADFRGHTVPEILLSGNHAAVKAWRAEQSLQKTQERRPDLL